MKEILKYLILFFLNSFIVLSKESNDDVRQDLASTSQGHLVEKKYLRECLCKSGPVDFA